jgi:hypothetical protein
MVNWKEYKWVQIMLEAVLFLYVSKFIEINLMQMIFLQTQHHGHVEQNSINCEWNLTNWAPVRKSNNLFAAS